MSRISDKAGTGIVGRNHDAESKAPQTSSATFPVILLSMLAWNLSIGAFVGVYVVFGVISRCLVVFQSHLVGSWDQWWAGRLVEGSRGGQGSGRVSTQESLKSCLLFCVWPWDHSCAGTISTLFYLRSVEWFGGL